MTTWDSNKMGSKGELSGGGLVFTNGSGTDGWVSVLASDGKTSGKWYFEIYYETLGGNPFALVGLGNASANLESYIGSDANGWGYRSNNGMYHDGSSIVGPNSWGGTHSIGVAVDMDAGKVWFCDYNGNWYGDPAAGTGEAFSGLSGTLFAAATLYDADGEITLRTLDADFYHSVPSGFTAYGDTGPAAVTWDPNNAASNIALSNGNLDASGDSATIDPKQVLATLGRSSGKYYFEVKNKPWTLAYNSSIGVQNGSEDLETYCGDTLDGWGYWRNARLYHSALTSVSTGWTGGDIVMVAVDLDAGKLWFGVNGTWIEGGDPANGTGEQYSDLSGTIYPSAGPVLNDHVMTGCFAAADQTYAVPTGFSDWEGGSGAPQTALEDVSLDLAAYHEARTDLATLLEATYLLGLEDLALALETWAWGRADLSTALQAAKIGRHDLATALDAIGGHRQDLAMLLSTVSPLVLRDMRLFLVLTDGVKRQDLALALNAIQKAPSHRAVIAQRLASTKKEAALV